MTFVLLTAYPHNNCPVYWVPGELSNYFLIHKLHVHIHHFFAYQCLLHLIYALDSASATLSCIYCHSMFKCM